MISYVIATRDEDPEVLRRTVEGIRATTPRLDREIVVVDDGSRVAVSGLGDDVLLIRNHEPQGSSSARRSGFAAASGSVLVSLDAHMSFDPGWLDPLLDEAATGAVVCAAFWDYPRAEPCAWGADLAWSSTRAWDVGTHPGFLAIHRREDPGSGAHDVPSLLGACYMMRRSTYEAIGGWCPVFRVWGAEEPDLSVRAWKAGFPVRCVADSRVGHLNQRAFRYPVAFDHVEFNQIVMLRSLFEYRTIERLERDFAPLSPIVAGWLSSTPLAEWRTRARASALLTDGEFFARFVPDLHARLAARDVPQ